MRLLLQYIDYDYPELTTAVLVTTLWVINVEKEHAAHDAHIREEHGGDLPEIPRYPYLNIRSTYCQLPARYLFLMTCTQIPLTHGA